MAGRAAGDARRDERLDGRTVLVVGLARSGRAVGALLRRRGARAVGVDDAPEAALRERWRREGGPPPEACFDEVHTGGAWPRTEVDAVAVSPGVPADHPGLAPLRGRVPILGELEWGARFCRARLVAVTGTNGKSTTTAMAAHLARAAGLVAEALGNIGRPLSEVADTLAPDAVAVVEVSSFQLETIDRFRPLAAAVLNLAPDHLDRHGSLAGYYDAKRRLAAAVDPAGRFVAWTGCPEALSWRVAAPRVLFGDPAAGAAVFWRDGRLHVPGPGGARAVGRGDELARASAADRLNAAAAVALLLSLPVDPEALAAGLRDFRGLPHRQQPVARRGGVLFVDDSKGTNVAAVVAGLRGRPGPLVLIAGGRGKGEDYAPLRGALGAVRAVVTIGEEGPAIARALAGLVPTEPAATLAAAVARAADLAGPDGTVLLSPACASFDMFRDYHHRGEAFLAAALAAGARKEERP